MRANDELNDEEATVPEQQPGYGHAERLRDRAILNEGRALRAEATIRRLEAENARLREQERSIYQRALDAEAHAAFGPMDVDARVRALRALVDQLERERDDARAQAIRDVAECVTEVINEASMRGHAVPDAVGMLDIILRTFGGDRV